MTHAAADTSLSPDALFSVLEATWPPAACHPVGAWRICEGRGGGKRVSAARTSAPDPDIAEMERAQATLGQPALVMVRPEQTKLDMALNRCGYAVVDPTVGLAARLEDLAQDPPRLRAFEVAWPPLEAQSEIWAEGGVGPERRAVMGRADGPRTTLLGRSGDAPVAAAFVACHGDVAMLHALEVRKTCRRQGTGAALMAAAARWATRQGARHLAVLVTRANAPALALYHGLGLREITSYHYRVRLTGAAERHQ